MLSNGFIRLMRGQVFHHGSRFCSSPPHPIQFRVSPDVATIKGLPEFSKEDNVEMMSHFPTIVNDLTNGEGYKFLPDFVERFTELLHYTVPTGKKVRGITTLMTYRMLENPNNITKENLKLASILGWCAELLEASILIIDDIVDNSDVRRNLPCWYKIPHIGHSAILDAVMLENSVQLLLKKYLSWHPHYVPITELFHFTNYMTCFGQILDCQKYKTNQITMELYSTITKYKTEYYTFTFGVTLGMHLSKMYNKDLYHEVQPILKELGKYFQIKNDYNDCFGDPTVTGKSGTDIQEGKCTWLSARTLEKANSTQYSIMAEHFGKPEEESVEAIMKLYRELNLPEEIQIYEEQSFERLCNQIKKMPHESVSNLLFTLVEKLYKREPA